jgi:S-DNA-T family DNA segregation ATPase FtsK/SpoIIIE
MVKVQKNRRAAPERTHLKRDIYGLALVFLGLACLFCLCWPQPGLLPSEVDRFLRLLAGSGAYVLPLALIFIGGVFLMGFDRIALSSSSIGSLLLFLVFVTWRHIALVRNPLQWTDDEARAAGGWLGGIFGYALYGLVGPYISYLLLLLPALVGIVLITDQPLVEIMRRIRRKWRAGEEAARQRAQETRAAKGQTAALPDTRKPAAPALEVKSDRAERAARVAERALTPKKDSAQTQMELLPPVERDDGKEHNTARTLLHFFQMTRRRRDGESEVSTVPPESATPRKENAAQRHTPETKTKPKPEPAAKPSPEARPQDPLPAAPFALPPITLLKDTPLAVSKRSQNELTEKIHVIEQTLEQFHIGANVVEVASGPSVTRYEIQLAPGIKVNKIVSLADNLAMSLAAIDVRVEAPIPGKCAIGLEVPNATPVTVGLRECIDRDEFRNAPTKLTIALGKDVAGQYRYADLTKMPHLLIGGSTNSGKSACLNALIASLVYRATPREVRLLMIDPKRVELSLWDGIPHLMHPVVKDVKQAAGLFRAALKEMDRRYDLFANLGSRNIDSYNERVIEEERLPYIVLIVDELADLMMQQGPEIETSICRLAQLARATGIHLVIATQRPSVDIITGTIKANIASRIAFAVASQVDSRTILDMQGAERLIGRGDMLFMPIDAAKPLRIQGCYLSEKETNDLVRYLKEQEKPHFAFALAEASEAVTGGRGGQQEEDVDDALFEQATRLVVNNGQASTSMLQRRFRIGYTRAARIVEMMEERGIVGPLNGAKPREILISKDQVEQMFNPGGAIPSVEAYQDEG